MRALSRVAGLLLVAAVALTACTAASGSNGSASGDRLRVVAAENFWGSIAAQIGGDKVEVTSIITNPNTDPHSYEPTAADARTIATADLVIINGIGYDHWASQLVAADGGGQTVLDVGDRLKVPEGGNPHRWYNPGDVQAVVRAMVADLARLDPRGATYFQTRRTSFDTVALRPYDRLISEIRSRYGGTPVGASESIFSMLAPALGLRLLTPYSFLRAISEGTDPTAADKATIDTQIRHHLIKIYVYNRQNATPDIQVQLQECRAAGIPTTTITETLAPAGASYQAWQTRQLRGILTALIKASRVSPSSA